MKEEEDTRGRLLAFIRHLRVQNAGGAGRADEMFLGGHSMGVL